MFLLLVIGFFAIATNAQPNGPDAFAGVRRQRMVGGREVDIEAYPHQVSIELDGHHFCGGSIISKYYVLTAAHCTLDLSNETDPRPLSRERLRIRSGTSLSEEGGSLHEVASTRAHESFFINTFNNANFDIALVRVEPGFAYGSTRRVIKLASREQGQYFQTRERAAVVGWGWVRFLDFLHPETAARQLQILELPLVPKSTCSNIYRKFRGIYKGQICAGYKHARGKDVCYGDSGGPLTFRGELIGVASYIKSHCGLFDYPAVYTEVAYFTEWIKKHAVFDE